ncbi:preprotein translocase subunit SecY [Candidatus Legionella polyplacis]|uniref:preprotein translocase subunit SecY n=1 Tax=Candidatus Legionella polyplacis TaxID=2005262 RepID=UPI000C1F3332|nr:preprotein translocase subunit SecY [Candidatus Legionella polyplacis]ATW01747.1 preprotein translocase subunit SecY [Candidatus Legionella polyplacis]
MIVRKSGLKEINIRLFFLFVSIVVYRLGSYIPVPGLNLRELSIFFQNQQNTIFGLFNMFSGGSLSRFTVFAIGIVPYISSSIIVQLLSLVIPSLDQLKKEGVLGRKKINQYVRYLTLLLSVFQSLGMARWLVVHDMVLYSDILFYFITVITLVTGTMFLMWLGEQITERGIGNGISLIIFSGIVSSIPSSIIRVVQQEREGKLKILVLLLFLLMMIFIISFVVFIERAQRCIRVNYAQRTYGRKIYAAQSSHLPLKINVSGVIPPIFASSIILLPAMLIQFFEKGKITGLLYNIGLLISPGRPLYLFIYSFSILFFSFFYATLVFNPKDTAENLKKSGAYILGIRPGEQTMKYIYTVMMRLTLFGATYLMLVCLLPQLLMYTCNVPFYFGGTSILIVVVVVMDFISQIQAHLMTKQYDSLIKKANFKGIKLPKFL